MSYSQQKGFGAVEAILIVVVIGVLGFVGWRVYDSMVNTTQDAAQVTPPPAAVTADTKSFTTQYEKINFTYPTRFTLTDTSKALPIVRPGMDNISLATDNNWQVSLQAGLYGVGGACPGCKVVLSEPVHILDQNLYLNYVSDSAGKDVQRVVVTTTKTDTFGGFSAKHIWVLGENGKPEGLTSAAILISKVVKDELQTAPLATWQADPDFIKARAIVKSMTYVK